jgi:effector-binding domain-containing protein
MLTIGRFADTTGLTVRALRHYDEIGLLVPAQVDEDNGYRYYDTAQVEDAVTIRRLRALELSALVEGGDEAIEVEIRDIPELRLAGTIRHLQLVDPAGVEEMLQLAADRLAELAIAPVGPATALFRGGDGDGTHLVEAGFPVGEGIGEDDLLRLKTYPAASAATAEHVGSYDRLPVTSQRFIATVLGQGLRFAQAIRIEFLERDARARLVWPVATEEGRDDERA